MPERKYDAIVVGAGPNGLSAAITLARAGRSVLLREAGDCVGGGCRSAALTLAGFVHDICSTVQAMAQISPFFRSLPLHDFGLELVHPAAAYAHPLDDGSAAICEQSVEKTADALGEDAQAYRNLMSPMVQQAQALTEMLLGPVRLPAHPLSLAKFGLHAIRSAAGLARKRFKTPAAQALFAGAAAHSMLPLESAGSAAFGLVLNLAAHAGGWPVARGGSQKLADALASYLRSLGGQIELSAPVRTLDELPSARAVLCDITPKQLIQIAGPILPDSYVGRLRRFRYGPGAFKLDWALDGPVPWRAQICQRAGTVHLGGTLEEVAASERAAWQGRICERPFVLMVQSSLFDPTRAPPGNHTAWGYCHVPNGCDMDMTSRIETQIERFAPGFRDRVIARHVMSPADLERHNANLVGGDICGGANNLAQLFTRPVPRLNPYSTPVPGLYLCSASTPPGGGVHGMCGYFAAKKALQRELQ